MNRPHFTLTTNILGTLLTCVLTFLGSTPSWATNGNKMRPLVVDIDAHTDPSDECPDMMQNRVDVSAEPDDETDDETNALSTITLTDKELIKAIGLAMMQNSTPNRAVVISGAHIKGNVNLSQAGMGARAMSCNTVTVNTELVFIGCVFEGDLRTWSQSKTGGTLVGTHFSEPVSFVNCTFLGQVDMRQSTFDQLLTMTGCNIKGATQMGASTYRAGVLMTRSTCAGSASFDAARFGPQTNFVRTHFEQSVIWQNAWFEGHILMADMKTAGYADLSHVTAMGNVNMSNSYWGGRVECRNAYFAQELRLAGATFGNMLTVESVNFGGLVDLNGAHIDGRTELTNCTFGHAPMTNNMTKGAKATVEATGCSVTKREPLTFKANK